MSRLVYNCSHCNVDINEVTFTAFHGECIPCYQSKINIIVNSNNN